MFAHIRSLLNIAINTSHRTITQMHYFHIPKIDCQYPCYSNERLPMTIARNEHKTYMKTTFILKVNLYSLNLLVIGLTLIVMPGQTMKINHK